MPQPKCFELWEFTYESDGAAARTWSIIAWVLMAVVVLSNAIFFYDNIAVEIGLMFVPLAMLLGFHVSVTYAHRRDSVRSAKPPSAFITDEEDVDEDPEKELLEKE